VGLAAESGGEFRKGLIYRDGRQALDSTLEVYTELYKLMRDVWISICSL
jgi:hypothetical protein